MFFNSEFLSLSQHSKTKGADKGTDLICVSLYDYHDGHQHLHAVVCLPSVATLDKSISDKNLQLYTLQNSENAEGKKEVITWQESILDQLKNCQFWTPTTELVHPYVNVDGEPPIKGSKKKAPLRTKMTFNGPMGCQACLHYLKSSNSKIKPSV